MKLSAAIRIGSMTTKHIKGNFTDGGNGRCVIGAALDAVGVKFKAVPGFSDRYNFDDKDRWAGYNAYEKWRYLEYYGYSDNLYNLIVDWNNLELMTREEIADQVEMIEEAEDYYDKFGRESSCPLKVAVKA